MPDFNQDFTQFLYGRVSSSCESLKDDPEEQKLIIESLRLYDKIRNLLGPLNETLISEFEQLIFDYEHAIHNRNALALDQVYKAGLKDGITLMRELGLLAAGSQQGQRLKQ